MKVVSYTQENYQKVKNYVFPLQILTFSINTFRGAACVVIRFFKKTVRVFTCNIEFTIHKISKKNMNIHIWYTPSCELLTSSKNHLSPLRFQTFPRLNSCPFGKTKPCSWAHRPVLIATGLGGKRQDGWRWWGLHPRSEVSHLAKGITSPAPEFLIQRVFHKFSVREVFLPHENSHCSHIH